MGGRVSRALRNFNLENRAHAEIGRQKPSSAPRHPGTKALGQQQQLRHHPDAHEVHNKDEDLLSLLKDVYVDSKDTPAKKLLTETSKQLQERRLLKSTLKHDPFGITNVPKGKLSIVEALTVLNNHKLQPEIWTTDKIAEDYSLELKDVKGLLEFFKPFEIKVLPPKQNKELLTAR